MAWVRTPDELFEREEVLSVGLDAVTFHLAALGYSNRNLTDGRIPSAKARTLIAVDDAGVLIERLVAAGWWHATDGGYQLVYLLDLQPTASSVLEKREKTARRVAEYRARSNGVTTSVSTPRVQALPGTRSPDPVPGSPDPEPGPAAAPASLAAASGGRRRGRRAPQANDKTPTNARLARIVDVVRAHGVPIHPSGRDGSALKSCAADDDLIAEAYIAAARGEWDPVDDGFLQGNLSLHLVIDRLAGFEADAVARSPAVRDLVEQRDAVLWAKAVGNVAEFAF